MSESEFHKSRRLEKSRVLWIDDHDDTIAMMTFLFERAGFICRRASTREAARLMMRRGLYDLYIVDHFLPDAFGTDLIVEIRKKDKNTPILFVSGDVRKDTHDVALRCGAQFAVAKPFDPLVLVSLSKRVIADEHVRSLHAKIVADRAVLTLLTEHAHAARLALQAAQSSIDRAHRIHAAARSAFLKAGGTPANFPRLWDSKGFCKS